MTRRRDNYRGQIDGTDDCGDRGAMVASRDLYAALLFLTSHARKSDLCNELVEVGSSWQDGVETVETMTVGQLLRIASDAYNQSLNDVVFVYRQLLVNADAADAISQVIGSDMWRAVRGALHVTLNQRRIAKRGLVNAAKRELAARSASAAREVEASCH